MNEESLRPKRAYELNREIERLIDARGEDPNRYTAEEKALLSRYSGYGGLDQYMGKDEAHAGILFEYYTPMPVVRKMWGLALRYGFRGGQVLEPAAGVGVFLGQAPARRYLDRDAYFTAIEPQTYSAKIMKVLYPAARIKEGVFEQEFISKYNESIKGKVEPKYDLVIGNPPYGSVKGTAGGKYFNMGEKQHTSAQAYDEYFIFRGLDLLKPGGLLIYIIGSEVANGGVPFLKRGATATKTAIGAKSTLLDAYRLPNGIFDRTDVLSDIVVFQKKLSHDRSGTIRQA